MYYPIPANTTKLHFIKSGCGSPCACNYFELWATVPTDRLPNKRLWYGIYVGDPDENDREEMLEEAKEACEHYGLPTEQLTLDNFWDIDIVKEL